MTDDRPSEVLGGLPRTRPHRRSDKRTAPAAKSLPQKAATTSKRATKQPASDTPKAGRLRQPAQPAGTPSLGGRAAPRRPRPAPPPRRPAAPSGSEILGTAVQAAAEIAEIGLTASARALRNALARLPRP